MPCALPCARRGGTRCSNTRAPTSSSRARECRHSTPRGADLAFGEKSEDGAVWIVIDFKTDHELASKRREYQTQVALYAEAILRATGGTARSVLLIV